MALVISDSSVLIHLARIDRLDLLKTFFRKITLPPSVWREVVDEGRGRPGAFTIEKAQKDGWINVVEPQNKNIIQLLMQQLDAGEAQALALAIEHENSTLLIDEAEGRKIASIYHVHIIGTIGLLIRAFYENKINSFQAELDRLVNEGGFRISKNLYEKVRNQVK